MSQSTCTAGEPMFRELQLDDLPTRAIVDQTLGTEYSNLLNEITALNQQIRAMEREACCGRLAASIIHDMNNQLTVLTGNLDLALKNAPSEGALHDELKSCVEVTEFLAQCTQGFLSLSRGMHKTRQEILLSNLARRIKKTLLDFTGRYQGVHFACSIDDNLPPISGNLLDLLRVADNLIANACRAMSKGGELNVTITAVSADSADWKEILYHGDWILLSVSDTGCGIPDDVIPNMLKYRYTSRPNDGGNGLGLYQVARFLETCDGRFFVKTKIGQGTTIMLALPIYQQ